MWCVVCGVCVCVSVDSSASRGWTHHSSGCVCAVPLTPEFCCNHHLSSRPPAVTICAENYRNKTLLKRDKNESIQLRGESRHEL